MNKETKEAAEKEKRANEEPEDMTDRVSSSGLLPDSMDAAKKDTSQEKVKQSFIPPLP